MRPWRQLRGGSKRPVGKRESAVTEKTDGTCVGQQENKSVKREGWALLIVLPLVILACLSLWIVRNFYSTQFVSLTRVESENGVYDLTGVDFSAGFVHLEGKMTYIPGILTPEEFTAREDEAVLGSPQDVPAATSRMTVKLPDDAVYMVADSSIDYAHKAYFNGALRFQAGMPAATAGDFEPGYGEMAVEITPKNGMIEIVQQGANFVHREGGGHALYLGSPAVMQRYHALRIGPEIIILGLFAALFLVHLMLFLLRRSYKANLIFSLLCLTWTVRTGLTGVKVFFALVPSLPWQFAFRTEYLTLAAALFLLVLLARAVFPGVPQKWFVWVAGAAAAGFAILCFAADTVLLSWALLAFEGVFTAASLYMCVRFIIKLPGMARAGTLKIEQAVSLTGFGIMMFAAIHDALYHMDVPLPLNVAVTGAAMLVFAFLQMTAMFYGTMRETARAHERELKALTEKELLAEMNRLKNQFYTDMSHEMKTPLTVISVNAQFAAQNLEAGVADEETAEDLTAISTEARRLAQMVTSLVGIGRMQGTRSERDLLSVGSLLTETARVYQSMLEKRKNTLTVKTPSELPPVTGSADQLSQVLINLLSNANRHTQGGAVTMRAEALDGRVRVSVTDTGEGIDPELLPHVFERFLRGHGGNVGLGLPICKAIIEEHGGAMGIESQPGKGTRVWFTLPVREEKEDG